jgi:3-hydroxyisobutyrate dehydrogenase-like beta-hydroxyacid dehydrogenase
MCVRLLDAGVDLSIWNRTPEKAKGLVDRGATLVAKPSDLAGLDIVFTMVAASDHLKLVTAGTDGVLTAAAAAPAILVDCSTVSPEASEEVREVAASRGCILVAAPVSGNPKTVRVGRATFAVSGPRPAFDTIEPLLRIIGADATWVGEGDRARLVKICHNVFLAVIAQSLAEITVLAESGGIRRADFLQFLNASVMGSAFTQYKTPAYVNRNYAVTFTPALLRKDLDLGLGAGGNLGVPLPLAERVREIVDGMIVAGYEDVDFAALLEVAATAANFELGTEDDVVADGLDDPAPALA